MLNVLACAYLKTVSLGNYYAKHKSKERNIDLPDLDSKFYCLELVPTSNIPDSLSGDRDFPNMDLQSSPLMPWYNFSMPTKTFVLIIKIIHVLTPRCTRFASMNPADSYILWRLCWPQSWVWSWGCSILCSGHLAKEQQTRGKQL